MRTIFNHSDQNIDACLKMRTIFNTIAPGDGAAEVGDEKGEARLGVGLDHALAHAGQDPACHIRLNNLAAQICLQFTEDDLEHLLR
jgi:hypothetical protein